MRCNRRTDIDQVIWSEIRRARFISVRVSTHICLMETTSFRVDAH